MPTTLALPQPLRPQTPPPRESPPILGPDANGITMTADEFDAVDEWDENFDYELIQGVVVVNPIPVPSERGPNEELGHWLLVYRDLRPGGSVLDATLPEEYVHLTNGSRRRADRLIWCGLGRLPNPKIDVATVAVEFVSRRRRDWRRDYEEKRIEYQAVGIREYWIIDRFRRTMTVYFLDGSERTIEDNTTYETPLLPGFQLPVGRLFQIADQWADEG